MKTHIHYSALRLLLFPSSPYLLFRLISLVATDVYPTVILRRYTRPFHNIWQWWHCRSSRRRAARGKITLSDDIANITYFLIIHIQMQLNNTEMSLQINESILLPDKCVSLVLEDADLLYGTKIGESLLQQLFWKTVRNATAVYRAVGWTWLVIHFVKSQRLGIGCKRSREDA